MSPPRKLWSGGIGVWSTQPSLPPDFGPSFGGLSSKVLIALSYGHGPKRSALLALLPTTTESCSRDHTPGATPSSPPAVTKVTFSALVAKRPSFRTYQLGRSHTPRFLLRVAVNCSNVAMMGWPLGTPPARGFRISERTPNSVSP